jgi:ubiquitin C-terminal hydrolase
MLNTNYKSFNNIGNTCYLNSGLQMIIHNKDFCKSIISNNNDIEIKQFIIDYYNNISNAPMNPICFKNLVAKKNKEFSGFKQNDSFEFIIYLLDNLIYNKNIYQITTNISIKCKIKNCLNINKHEENNLFLILDINKDTTHLDDAYRSFKMREKLIGDNLYYCDKCKTKRIASKRTEIIKWPKHLIIILKRFDYNNQKNNKNIIIPLFWRHGYKLKGIVFHSGSLFGGHYIYIGLYNNKWLIMNDDYIKEITIDQLDNYKNVGYIFYYEQI